MPFGNSYNNRSGYPHRVMTEEDALRRLAALCAKGEHCTGELDDKMRRWGLDEAARCRVLDYLISRQFVDDSRFCRSFVTDKIRFEHWGRRKIEQALWQKHVAKEISAPILDAIPDEEYMEQLRPLLKAKWPSVKGGSDYERSMKLIKWAMSRGFSLEQIRKAIDEMGVEADELPDE